MAVLWFSNYKSKEFKNESKEGGAGVTAEKEKKPLLSLHVRDITAGQNVPKNQMLPEWLSREGVQHYILSMSSAPTSDVTQNH